VYVGIFVWDLLLLFLSNSWGSFNVSSSAVSVSSSSCYVT